MRKIEKWMIDAINSQRLASKGKLMNDGLTSHNDNTMICTRLRHDGEAVTTVYLHGNLIASYSSDAWGFTLHGWNTPTTKSRINALAMHYGRSGVHQSKGKLFSGDKEINKYDWF